MGRARGVVAQQVLAALKGRPQAACDLVAALAVPERTLKDVLHRLVAAKVVAVLRTERREGARRPVHIYILASEVPVVASPVLDPASLWRAAVAPEISACP